MVIVVRGEIKLKEETWMATLSVLSLEAYADTLEECMETMMAMLHDMLGKDCFLTLIDHELYLRLPFEKCFLEFIANRLSRVDEEAFLKGKLEEFVYYEDNFE